jgi:alpha-methylacyl-CoA racemase
LLDEIDKPMLLLLPLTIGQAKLLKIFCSDTLSTERQAAMTQPLSNIRILDLSRLLPGAYATQMLADLGADVIKIEEPGSGDYSRIMPPYSLGGMGLYFLATNRNKRSMTLNLKLAEGREIFLRLVKEADVVLESFRPGVLERLGLGYQQLKEVNPRLVYCAISGYGQDGPYRLRAGHDLNYAGYAGLLDYNRGPNGEPVMPPTQLGDLAGGSFLSVIGILSALLGRNQTGEGRMVDVSMTEGVMALLPLIAAAYLNSGEAPRPGTSALDGGLPCYNIYETRDGKHITLAALEQKFWHTFCTRSGHPELLLHHLPTSVEERVQTIEALRTIFKTRTRDEWLAELAEIDACVGPVYSLAEVFSDPQAQARGVKVASGPIGDTGAFFQALPTFPRLSASEQEPGSAPPDLGQHTNELLQELNYNQPEIEELRTRGVI